MDALRQLCQAAVNSAASELGACRLRCPFVCVSPRRKPEANVDFTPHDPDEITFDPRYARMESSEHGMCDDDVVRQKFHEELVKELERTLLEKSHAGEGWESVQPLEMSSDAPRDARETYGRAIVNINFIVHCLNVLKAERERECYLVWNDCWRRVLLAGASCRLNEPSLHFHLKSVAFSLPHIPDEAVEYFASQDIRLLVETCGSGGASMPCPLTGGRLARALYWR